MLLLNPFAQPLEFGVVRVLLFILFLNGNNEAIGIESFVRNRYINEQGSSIAVSLELGVSRVLNRFICF